MPKLTDKERLDIQLGKGKRKLAGDGLPKASRIQRQANYGPSSSYAPASDYAPPCDHEAREAAADNAGE